MQRVYRALALFAGVLAVGAVLFRSIERLDWFDAFYTALLSVTPLGHGLMPPLSRAGRQLNAFLLVCGVGVVGYAASIATRFVFEGESARVEIGDLATSRCVPHGITGKPKRLVWRETDARAAGFVFERAAGHRLQYYRRTSQGKKSLVTASI